MKALFAFPDRQPRPSAIEKALTARVVANVRMAEIATVAGRMFPGDALVADIATRGVAPLGTTTGAGFAAELAPNLVGEFVSTLIPTSAAAAIIARGFSVSMAGVNSMLIPAREGAPSALVSWAGEGDPIAVRQYGLNSDATLAPRKFAFIIAISREAAKRANGDAVIRQLMREDASLSLDAAYFSTDTGDADVHAGMLAGVEPLEGYPGADRLAMEADLASLSDAVSAGGSGDLMFVAAPRRVNRWRIRYPDLAREMFMLPSLAIAEDAVVAVDPGSWMHGFGGDFSIDVSNASAVHMSTAPLEIVDGSGTHAAPVRSLWQTDSLGYRLVTDLAFAARRPNAAAHLTGATW